MPGIVSELEEMGFKMPDFKNSNLSLMEKFTDGHGRHLKSGKKSSTDN